MEFLGVVLIVVLIPLVWFFGGHEWERFRLFGVPVFILGIILINPKPVKLSAYLA